MNLESGKIQWSHGENRSEAFATPAVNDTLVVFASDDGKITALKRDDGKKLWVFDSDGEPGSVNLLLAVAVCDGQFAHAPQVLDGHPGHGRGRPLLVAPVDFFTFDITRLCRTVLLDVPADRCNVFLRRK